MSSCSSVVLIRAGVAAYADEQELIPTDLPQKADRPAQSRELAPTGPFGFWLEKIF
jgi:hypothetical protein